MYFTFTFQVFASARATRHQNTAVQKNKRAANEWMQTVERLQKIKEKEITKEGRKKKMKEEKKKKKIPVSTQKQKEEKENNKQHCQEINSLHNDFRKPVPNADLSSWSKSKQR